MTQVEAPFVPSADEAVQRLLGKGVAGIEAAVGAAYAVCRERSRRTPVERVATPAWFVNDLEEASLERTANRIRRTLQDQKGRERLLVEWLELESTQPGIGRTQEAGDRRLFLERLEIETGGIGQGASERGRQHERTPILVAREIGGAGRRRPAPERGYRRCRP